MSAIKDNDVQIVRKPSRRYISRLEAVQVAIFESLSKIEDKNPERRVVLVTFNRDVTVFGDGKAPKLIVQGQDLESIDSLQLKVQKSPVYENIGRNLGKLKDEVVR